MKYQTVSKALQVRDVTLCESMFCNILRFSPVSKHSSCILPTIHFHLKGTYFSPFNKSPQCVCEVLAHFYGMSLNAPFFVPLIANELVFLAPFSEEDRASRAHAPEIPALAFANKHSTISTSLLSLNAHGLKVSHLIVLCIIHVFMNYTDGKLGAIQIMTLLVSWCHSMLLQTL